MAPAPMASSIGGPNWNSTHFTLETPDAFSRFSMACCLRTSTRMVEPFWKPMRTSDGSAWADAGGLQVSGTAATARAALNTVRRWMDPVMFGVSVGMKANRAA